MDKLANGSVIFDKAYSLAPWTLPSISSIITSLNPIEHRAQKWGDRLSTKHTTLAEHLKLIGYKTAAVTSHNLIAPEFGFDQGFDLFDESVLQKGDPHNTSTSAEITDLGIRLMDELEDQPFFLWLYYFDPHYNYMQRPEYRFGQGNSDKYDSEIAFLDHHIGRLLDHLADKKLESKTMVILVADHGEEFKDHGGTRHGHTLYEELVHIPLIIRGPGLSPRRVNSLVAETDIAPTILALAGLPKAPSFKGQALPLIHRVPLTASNRSVFLESYYENTCLRGVRTSDWKLVNDCNEDSWQLFDLSTDPKETKDVKETQEKEFLAGKKLMEGYFTLPPRKMSLQNLTDEEKEKLRALGYINN